MLLVRMAAPARVAALAAWQNVPALRVDEALPREPMRQWVLSFPYELRFLLAQQPAMTGKVLEIAHRTLARSRMLNSTSALPTRGPSL